MTTTSRITAIHKGNPQTTRLTNDRIIVFRIIFMKR